jgi:hypothetical protein
LPDSHRSSAEIASKFRGDRVFADGKDLAIGAGGDSAPVSSMMRAGQAREARMPKIYVNTDNSNPRAKIYEASKVGKSAAAAEQKMQETVRAMITKEADFVSDKSAVGPGYTIRIKVTNAVASGGTTTYTVHYEVVRFPVGTGKGGGKGEFMVSTRTKDLEIQVQGNSQGMLLDGVEMVTQNIMKACFPMMRVDMTNR